mgnify:CR=1 FL=1
MLEQVDELQEECEETFGALPEAAQNLFDRTRIRIRADRLGLESVALIAGKLTYQGVDVPKGVAFDLRTKLGAIAFPKTRKFTVPLQGRGRAAAAASVAASTPMWPPAAWAPCRRPWGILAQLGPSGDDD